MKTTLDGVVFCCRTCQVMQKRSFTAGGFSPDRGKGEETACAIRANPAEPGRWGGRTRRQNRAAGRSGKTERQDGAAGRSGRTERQNRAARRIGKTDRQDGAAGRSGKTDRQDGAAGRSGKTERQDGAAGRSGKTERQDGAAGRSGRTERQDGAAGRGGRTERQDGAAGRGGRTGRQKKRGRAKPGHRSGQVRGRRPHKQKTGETIGPARFSTGIPTAGSRRTAKKRTEKRPGICKRPTHRFSIRCSDTGKGAILSVRPPLVK